MKGRTEPESARLRRLVAPVAASRDAPIEPVRIEPIIAELRRHILERAGRTSDLDEAVYDLLGRILTQAPDTLAGTLFSEFVGPEQGWEVDAQLVLRSHRHRLGGLVLLVKRFLLLPAVRWLYDYTWANLRRQQRLNVVMLSSIEALVEENARLRGEIEGRIPLRTEPQPEPSAITGRHDPTAGATQTVRTLASSRPLRLAFVVQRYGRDIPGGSERHCREFAERLATRHDVSVLTSCARDYVSWTNAYAPGLHQEGPVRVHRFPVAEPRDAARWRDISLKVFSGHCTLDDERRWFRENGPYVPELLEHLERERERYDLFVFFTYRYYTTFAGLPLVAQRALLVPTAEEDPAIRLRILRQFFTLPLGIIQNTFEEHAMMKAIAGPLLPPHRVVGSGVAEPVPAASETALREHSVHSPFLLYLGRVDPNKGCGVLLDHFRRYRELGGRRELQLVLAGEVVMEVPEASGIRALGPVDDGLRERLLRDARLLVMPSPYESLSLALIEAWVRGTPALVNGSCRALRGQVERAQGGLYYTTGAEFQEAVDYLLDHPDVAGQLGRQGRVYAQREYGWDVLIQRLEEFLYERVEVAQELAKR